MKKTLFIVSLVMAMIAGSTMSAQSQTIVDSVKVKKIVLIEEEMNAEIEWDANDLTKEQIRTILRPGTQTVISSQEELTDEQMKLIIQNKTNAKIVHPEDYNEVARKGFHFDVETFFCPFSQYSLELSGDAPGVIYGKLENVNTFAIKAALVYQLSREFYVGGGTGLVSGQLHWTSETGGKSTHSYVLPVFARAGVCTAVSRKLCGYLNADLGVDIPLAKAETTMRYAFHVGIIYGNAKVAVGILTFKPDCEYFFQQNLDNKFAGGVGLTVGLRI